MSDIIANHGFSVPEKKYCLADAEYENSDYAIILYRGVQYLLQAKNLAIQKPKTAKSYSICDTWVQDI